MKNYNRGQKLLLILLCAEYSPAVEEKYARVEAHNNEQFWRAHDRVYNTHPMPLAEWRKLREGNDR